MMLLVSGQKVLFFVVFSAYRSAISPFAFNDFILHRFFQSFRVHVGKDWNRRQWKGLPGCFCRCPSVRGPVSGRAYSWIPPRRSRTRVRPIGGYGSAVAELRRL